MSSLASLWARIGLILLLAVIFTHSCVHRSKHFGRLSTALNYDDVVYIEDGLNIDVTFQERGFAGLRDILEKEDLHSPYSELLAALALLPFGFIPSAPYYANGLLILAYLGFLAYFFRRLDFWLLALLLIVFLFLPFATMGVLEFRPDIAWATVLGFNVVYAVTHRRFFELKKPAFVFGLLLGLALLIKPSTFVMTFLASGVAYAARLGLEFFRRPALPLAQIVRQTARNLACLLLTLLVVAGPYEYFYGRDAWNYFYENSFGANEAIWVYRGKSPWSYYLSGEGFQSNLGPSGRIVIIGALLLVYLRFRRLELYQKLELAALVAIFFFIYAVNSAAQMKSPFLGGAMYGTLIYTLAWILGEQTAPFSAIIWKKMAQGPRQLVMRVENPLDPAPVAAEPEEFILHGPAWLLCFPTLFLLALLFLATHLFQFPRYSKVDPEKRLFLRSVQDRLDDYFAHSPFPQTIVTTQSNPVVIENIMIWYLQHHARPFVATASLYDTMDVLDAHLSNADLIIAQDGGLRDNTNHAPAEPFQDRLVQQLRANPNYQLETTIPDGFGKSIYVFRRQPDPNQTAGALPAPMPTAH